MNLEDSTDEITSPTVTELLAELRSRQRVQPLQRNTFGAGETAGVNTLTTTNTGAPVTYTLYQLQADRDYSSVIDLLNIPLYGPESVTTMSQEARLSADGMTPNSNVPVPGGVAWTNGSGTGAPVPPPMWRRPAGVGLVANAGAKFLLPEFPDADTATTNASV